MTEPVEAAGSSIEEAPFCTVGGSCTIQESPGEEGVFSEACTGQEPAGEEGVSSEACIGYVPPGEGGFSSEAGFVNESGEAVEACVVHATGEAGFSSEACVVFATGVAGSCTVDDPPGSCTEAEVSCKSAGREASSGFGPEAGSAACVSAAEERVWGLLVGGGADRAGSSERHASMPGLKNAIEVFLLLSLFLFPSILERKPWNSCSLLSYPVLRSSLSMARTGPP